MHRILRFFVVIFWVCRVHPTARYRHYKVHLWLLKLHRHSLNGHLLLLRVRVAPFDLKPWMLRPPRRMLLFANKPFSLSLETQRLKFTLPVNNPHLADVPIADQAVPLFATVSLIWSSEANDKYSDYGMFALQLVFESLDHVFCSCVQRFGGADWRGWGWNLKLNWFAITELFEYCRQSRQPNLPLLEIEIERKE